MYLSACLPALQQIGWLPAQHVLHKCCPETSSEGKCDDELRCRMKQATDSTASLCMTCTFCYLLKLFMRQAWRRREADFRSTPLQYASTKDQQPLSSCHPIACTNLGEQFDPPNYHWRHGAVDLRMYANQNPGVVREPTSHVRRSRSVLIHPRRAHSTGATAGGLQNHVSDLNVRRRLQRSSCSKGRPLDAMAWTHAYVVNLHALRGAWSDESSQGANTAVQHQVQLSFRN